MAEKEASKPSKPVEPPQPVHIGGESFLDRIRPYLKQIAIGFAALAVVVVVVFVFRWIKESGQADATEKLDRVMQVARAPIRALGSNETPDPANPAYATVKDRSTAVLDALAKQDKAAEAAGAAFRAGLLLDAGKHDEAIAEYRKGIADKSLEKTIEGVLCREGLGLALEAKAAASKDAAARQKGFEEALAAFAAVQPDEAGLRHAHALYHQGRLQALLGKRDEARALFSKAKEANKTGDREIGELIEQRLAALGS